MRTMLCAGALLVCSVASADPDLPIMKVTSTQFADHGKLPSDMTCDGAEKLPQLTWAGAPDGTKGYAIVVSDLDTPSGSVNHWVVSGISENVTSTTGVPAGAVAGENHNGDNGWAGPCPPRGTTHHYLFTVFALDTRIADSGYDAQRLAQAMKGHILARGELVGLYARK